MKSFSFIAVNYNGASFTIEYIRSISNMIIPKLAKLEIIIVDNNSTEEDFNKIKNFCRDREYVKLLRMNQNLGYFKGLNQGIKETIRGADSFLITGNNDLTFDKNFLLVLNESKYDEDVLVIAPNIYTKDGRQQNPHVISSVSTSEKLKGRLYFSNYYIGKFLRLAYKVFKTWMEKAKPAQHNLPKMKIKRGIGACYVLTPNFFKQIGLLDERIFMWGEETLLSHQVESAGGTTLYDPSLIAYHHESAAARYIHSKKRYQMIRESYKIYKKYL